MILFNKKINTTANSGCPSLELLLLQNVMKNTSQKDQSTANSLIAKQTNIFHNTY